jgi:hypothetical protein
VVFEQPCLLVVEAKKDNFAEGWGQCLAELIAAQKLNASLDLVIFGIVSNGERWEFGKLKSNNFIKNRVAYTLQQLQTLCGALEDTLIHCKQQLT